MCVIGGVRGDTRSLDYSSFDHEHIRIPQNQGLWNIPCQRDILQSGSPFANIARGLGFRFLVVEPGKLILLIENTVTQKDDFSHSIFLIIVSPNQILLMCFLPTMYLATTVLSS